MVPMRSAGVSGSVFAAWTPARRRSPRSAGSACTAARAAGISAAFKPPPPPGASPTLLQTCTASRLPSRKRPAISSARPPP